jgi:hypothetical protein
MTWDGKNPNRPTDAGEFRLRERSRVFHFLKENDDRRPEYPGDESMRS